MINEARMFVSSSLSEIILLLRTGSVILYLASVIASCTLELILLDGWLKWENVLHDMRTSRR